MQWRSLNKVMVTLLLGLITFTAQAQTLPTDTARIPFFQPAESFSKKRFWTLAGTGTAIYLGGIVAANELWYRQFPRSGFHFFDDSKEWKQMDKAGHWATGYIESVWAYKGLKWTGIDDDKSMLIGAGVGMLLQSTVEVLDGFSTEWGFSLSDMAFNGLGVGAFYAQQKGWGEQRIAFKISGTRRNYSNDLIFSTVGNESTSFRERAADLYGTSIPETFLKDYNAQTIWASVNIHSFLNSNSKFPIWLNVAFGYGAENLYGGFSNAWRLENANYRLNESDFPRYRQFYISPDIDFTRIPTKSRILKTLFTALNVFKFPAPALEINSIDGVRFIGLHF